MLSCDRLVLWRLYNLLILVVTVFLFDYFYLKLLFFLFLFLLFLCTYTAHTFKKLKFFDIFLYLFDIALFQLSNNAFKNCVRAINIFQARQQIECWGSYIRILVLNKLPYRFCRFSSMLSVNFLLRVFLHKFLQQN